MVGHKTQRPAWQKKPPLTHFLCLPVVTAASQPQLDRSLRQFSAEVCLGQSESQDEVAVESLAVVHPKAIRPLGTLHLTLGVMSLDKSQLTKATELLESLDVQALLEATSGPSQDSGSSLRQDTKTAPLNISFKGLESMHAPESTSILYIAPMDQTDRLYEFCLALQKHFEEFLVPDDRPLRLHTTIVNTTYAKSKQATNRSFNSRRSASNEPSHGHGPNAKGSLKLDARGILQRYKGYTWAENVRLERISICEMGAKKITDAAGTVVDERYNEVAHFALPTFGTDRAERPQRQTL